MDLNHLSDDEIAVECSVRNIKGSLSEKLMKLSKRIEEEAKAPTIALKLHTEAYYNPNRELLKCQSKINEHVKWLGDLGTTQKVLDLDALRIESRLLHVLGRLHRLEQSRKYGDKAFDVGRRCLEILEAVQSILQNGNQDPNETLTRIRSTPAYDVSAMSDNEDDDAYEADCSNGRDNLSSAAESTPMHVAGTSSPSGSTAQSNTPSQIPISRPSVNPPPNTQGIFNDNIHKQLPSHSRSIQFKDNYSNINHGSNQYVQANSSSRASVTVPGYNPSSYTNLPLYANTDTNVKMAGHHSYRGHTQYRTEGTDQRNPEFVPKISSEYHQPTTSMYNHGIPTFQPPVVPFGQTKEARSLARCKMVYDGSPGGVPVESFVFRLERTARNLGLADSMLVDEISHVLKGVALDWYWCHLELNPVMTWLQLRKDLIARFQDRRTDFDIRRMIESRKQQKRESIIEFYNQILALTLQSRAPFPEAEILHLVRRNMRFGLQLALADRNFRSVSELIQSCVALEDTWTRLGVDPEQGIQPRRFVNELRTQLPADFYPEVPPPGTSQYVEAITPQAYRQPGSYSVPLQTQSRPEAFKESTIPHNKYGNQTTLQSSFHQAFTTEPEYCWNCFELGHFFKDCRKNPQHIFCFGCGRTNIIKPKCVHCIRKSENSYPGKSYPGKPSPANLETPRNLPQPTSAGNQFIRHPASDFQLLKRQGTPNHPNSRP